MKYASDIFAAPEVQQLLHAALFEDLSWQGDLTVNCLVPPAAELSGRIIAKAPGVVCGVGVLAAVAHQLEAPIKVTNRSRDGQRVMPGDELLRFRGPAAAVLIAERTTLNLMQGLSGVATVTADYVDLVAGTRCGIYDTRKTAPGQRLLQKYAVRCGGGHNHRRGLFDQVLIKENHLALMGGSAAEAVRRCRERLGPDALIEVEIERLDDLAGVITAGADIVLLDNMPPPLLTEAVARRDALGCDPLAAQTGKRPVVLEASGGITHDTLAAVAASGVERVSIGALTHSAPAMDCSMLCDL